MFWKYKTVKDVLAEIGVHMMRRARIKAANDGLTLRLVMRPDLHLTTPRLFIYTLEKIRKCHNC